MPRTSEEQRNLSAQRAAYLAAEHGLSQDEVGRLLGGIKQSSVSRLLNYAEEQGWLERRHRFIPDGLPAGRLEDLQRFIKPRRLIELLSAVTSPDGVRVRGVHVVDSGSTRTSAKAIAGRQSKFGRAAARIVAELLTRSDMFGITWGRTISHVVDAIGDTTAPRTSGRNIRFVPVCGEPQAQGSNPDTSSHLVERLHRLLGGNEPVRPPSLTGVTALIPRKFRGSDARGIRKFVDGSASYREIFGERAPLIRQVDSLLTSVGPAERPMGFINEELRTAGSMTGRPLTEEQLAKLVVGDVGGVLLPRRDLNAAARREVAALNNMWTGVKREHLERIATAAAKTNCPGVIVVSFGGAERAETIAEAVRCGLVNELIVDRQLAEELAKALAGGPSTTGQ